MFTGIVSAVGTVRQAGRSDDGLTLKIGAPYRGVRRGESLAVDGACLTVTHVGKGWFAAHVIETTLGRTLFGDYVRGRKVNLERALRVGDRLGGHIVQGHVDSIGRVRRVHRQGDAWLVDIEVPIGIERVSVPFGSIAVDGVSLTINAMPGPGLIQVSLIPFTFEHTTLGSKSPGDAVHIEGDAIGKYVEQLLRVRNS